MLGRSNLTISPQYSTSSVVKKKRLGKGQTQNIGLNITLIFSMTYLWFIYKYLLLFKLGVAATYAPVLRPVLR